MLLAIDAGNTSITAGCLEGGSLLCRAQFSAERRTADELAVLMGQALRMRGVDTAAFEGAVMSCVVPPLLEMLRGALASRRAEASTAASGAAGRGIGPGCAPVCGV